MKKQSLRRNHAYFLTTWPITLWARLSDCRFHKVSENGGQSLPQSEVEKVWGGEGFQMLFDHPKCTFVDAYKYSRLPGRSSRQPCPRDHLGGFLDVPSPDGICNVCSVFWVCPDCPNPNPENL